IPQPLLPALFPYTTLFRSTDVFPMKAKKLLLVDNAAVVFGCWTSVSRKNVLPVFEENNGLLFYPVPYEGNECSKNVVYTGATPRSEEHTSELQSRSDLVCR